MTGRAEFSVVEFYADDTHAYVERWLMARDAVNLANKCLRLAATARSASTKRPRTVIITDGGDNTVFEWQRGTGIVFPAFWKGHL